MNDGSGRVARRIVGVLPASFESAFHLPVLADVWVPMAIGPDDNTTRNVRWLTFVARLGPGAALEQARARVATLSKAAYADRSSEMLRAGYTLVPLDDYVVGNVRPALRLLLGAVAVLLLIACGNVSGLVLARALGRRRDLAIRAFEPQALIRDVRTLDEVRLAHVARPRFYAFLVGSFAALAALLAAVGLFGLMAYTVGQRTSELGVRMALGAPPDQLLRAVVGDGLKIVAIGLVLGLAGALAVTRVLGSLLFDLSATDPRVFTGAALLLLAVAALACYVPARRVLRVDPLATLRAE